MNATSRFRAKLCSNCFLDEGLKLNAIKIGIDSSRPCPNCGLRTGKKLNKALVQSLVYTFFTRGTASRSEYGGFPLIVANEEQYGTSSINVSPWLENDVRILEQAGRIGLFYYGPRAWMWGEIDPLTDLQSPAKRNQILARIVKEYPTKEMTVADSFYRVRVFPSVAYDPAQYDAPPRQFIREGRLETASLPILYASPDLDLCIHECRATADDELYVATLRPTKSLRMLDLTELLKEENVTEFESLDLAIHFLFLAGKHAYPICRAIAKTAYENGFDGIIYPSYFSYTRNGMVPFETVYGISIRIIDHLHSAAKAQIAANLAFFGRPVKAGKIAVECINRILINQVQYGFSFGPAYNKAYT